jgi:vacuolar-type H+-ATPase subunit H
MTSVEFIHEKLFCDEYWYEKLTFEQIIEQAKEMHKKEIENAYWDGGQHIPMSEKSCEQYYQETFKKD